VWRNQEWSNQFLIFLLLALSGFVGFSLGLSYKWRVLVPSALVLALVFSIILHKRGFDSFDGILVIVYCLVVNQLGYFAAGLRNLHDQR
jgi:carbon starvation protein CstA